MSAKFDKGHEHDIEFLESREDTAKPFEPTEQPFDLIAPLVHDPVVLPRRDPILLGRYVVAADARTAITFSLSPGQAHDAPEGRKLLRTLGKAPWPLHLLMDRAYEGDETRQLALDLGLHPRRTAQGESGHAMGVQPGHVQAAQ